jgi:hypothetical protein
VARKGCIPVRLAAACLAAVGVLYGAIALDRISADSLRANITWLAADEREGRMTPSAGLEASADYLAAQFGAAGLAPGGSGGTFFQTAQFAQITQKPDSFRMTLATGSRRVNVTGVSVRSVTAIDYRDEAVFPLRGGVSSAIAGRVVAGGDAYATEASLYSLRARKPSLILLTIHGSRPKEEAPILMEADPSIPPVIRIYSRAAASLLTGREEARLTLHVAAPVRHDVALRNVAGILRGSDPAVRDQFVILSAHYDHLGVRPPGQGNRIFHGANDNASGAASLIEIAKALAANPHPRRSVLFLAVFGEEEGLLGSGYYVRHPLIPIARTIADINLEQLGRTDSSDGPEIARFALTGPSYSNLPAIMSAAARTAGAVVYRKDTADDYFSRSDNYSFALAGIVAHTAVVAFEFPDYHVVSDEAEKLDYGNLVKVDRGIAAGVASVADGAAGPVWADTKAARVYRDAAR